MLCAGYNGGLTEIWDVPSGARLAALWGDPGAITDTAISRDGSTMVTASGTGRIALWDLRNRCETAALSGQLVSSFSVAFSPDESRIAACGGDGTLRIWEAQNKNQVARIKLHSERLGQLAFLDHETLVALAADRFGHSRLFVLRAPNIPSTPVSGATLRPAFVDTVPLECGSVDARTLNTAAAENLALFGLPRRATDTPARLIDLSAFYNLTFEGLDSWHFETAATNSPQKGRQHFGPVEHDVRGAIYLSCAAKPYLAFLYPRRVDGIPVGQKCRRMHFLHFVFDSESEGTQVASYALKFADGKTRAIPVRYGHDLRTWGSADPDFQLRNPSSALAWSGTNAASQPVRMFRTTWNNPRPNTPIASMDFISSMSQSSPVLVAVTTEP